MEDLNGLSNDELRYRLMQFGFPNLPVTSTTRKVLIKKLRNHLESEKSKLKRNTSYATRYSSDEELSSHSDAERSTNSVSKKRTAYPRTTVAQTSQSSRTKTTTRSNISMPPPLTSSILSSGVGSKTNVYVSPLLQSETDEESDANTTYSSRYSNLSLGISTRQSIAGASNSSFNGDESGVRSKFDQNDSTDSPNISGFANGVGAAAEFEAPPSCTKRLLSFRSTMAPPTTSLPENNKVYDRFSVPSYSTSYHSRYLSDGSSRLSAYPRDHGLVYQARNDRLASPYSDVRPFSIRNTISSFFNRFNERYGVKQSLVPCILLTSLFTFFAAVIIAYLTMNPDLSVALDARAATYKICPSGEIGFTTTQPSVNCIEETELEPSFELLKVLIPELQKRIEFNRCTDSSAVFAMSAKEVIQFLLEVRTQSAFDTIRTLQNSDYLISVNPQWRVSHFRDNSGAQSALIAIDEVARLRQSQSNYYAIVKPRLPVGCFLYNKLQTVFIIIGWIGVTALLAYAIVFGVQFVRSHLQTRRERFSNMIEDIKNVLMEKAYDPDTACTDAASVVVNHLRDKLIAPNDRSRLEAVWDSAIKFLEQNESRIQFSIATRNGEDYRVMRWVDTTTPTQQNSISFSSSGIPNASISGNACDSTTANPLNAQRASLGNVKKWQSPAFDKSNKIKDPPTECLKIRQMFEKYEANNPNLKQIITDAILEKVAHTPCKIYDVQLDKLTCCVYVRCATAKDAGIIHDEVNGWWFDSRLVSIKFLRLDRYSLRFPSTAVGSTCLKPSNSKNLSMTNNEERQNGNGKRTVNDVYDDDEEEDDDYYYNNH